MEDHEFVSEYPSVVPRAEIPISSAPEDLALEVRPFGNHKVLSSMIPSSAVALAWTHARPGQEVAFRSHSTPGLLIVLQGSAELNGGIRRCVRQGDVITLPSLHEYGFSDVGADGLHALHVAFHDEAAVAAEEVLTLEQLLAQNELRARTALNSPFFLLLRDGALESESARSMFRECLRVFSDAFQVILLTRQATCKDEVYRRAFDEHLLEELGHNKLLSVSGNPRAAEDPILQATASWFCHQMLVLDNLGKAVVHVVLETAGFYFHTLAKPVLETDNSAEYFHTHAEDDEEHMEAGARLLAGQHPETYRALYRVLEDTWNMFDAMTNRIAHLVHLERTSS
jgi:mannose-6-phosphate isomerase-like protein (cupin superfamily)